MPFNVALIVGAVGLCIALGVWWKTKRVGPVVGVLLGAFVVMAITDPTILSKGASAVGDFFGWIMTNVIKL